MRYLIALLALVIISTAAIAQVYTKESATAVKVTVPIATIYEVAKIKERIVDLTDYITLAEAQIIKFQQEIDDLNKLLVEAQKVGVDTSIKVEEKIEQ
jgi:hypothetical protein